MKTNILCYFFIIGMIVGCGKSASDPDFCADKMACNDCISIVEKVKGQTLFLSCFDHYAVGFKQNDSTTVWAIPYSWDDKYKKDSLNVTFCGYLYLNDLPLIIPDPRLGDVYRIKFEEID